MHNLHILSKSNPESVIFETLSIIYYLNGRSALSIVRSSNLDTLEVL